MALISKMRLRFHNWAIVVLLCFVLTLTALFLAVVIAKFNSMAENDAQERFILIVQTGVDRLRTLVGGTSREVTVQAHARRERFAEGGRLNDRDMVVTFMSQLESEESLYSAYFGLENDDFF